jgi:integrase
MRFRRPTATLDPQAPAAPADVELLLELVRIKTAELAEAVLRAEAAERLATSYAERLLAIRERDSNMVDGTDLIDHLADLASVALPEAVETALEWGTEAVEQRERAVRAESELALLTDAVCADVRSLPETTEHAATAMYGGLRRGELIGLRVEDVDLAAGKIHVRRGWDVVEGTEVTTKSRKARRVPVAAVLRDHLDQHLIGLDWREHPEGLVFGATATVPFSPSPLSSRAARAWKEAGLDPITLHECRHTFASLMIAAGVNAKALSEYMGHANISITLDRYGHLMPGNEEEAAGLLDAYLERADTAARIAAVEA